MDRKVIRQAREAAELVGAAIVLGGLFSGGVVTTGIVLGHGMRLIRRRK